MWVCVCVLLFACVSLAGNIVGLKKCIPVLLFGQSFRLHLDTGSSITWIPSLGCRVRQFRLQSQRTFLIEHEQETRHTQLTFSPQENFNFSHKYGDGTHIYGWKTATTAGVIGSQTTYSLNIPLVLVSKIDCKPTKGIFNAGSGSVCFEDQHCDGYLGIGSNLGNIGIEIFHQNDKRRSQFFRRIIPLSQLSFQWRQQQELQKSCTNNMVRIKRLETAKWSSSWSFYAEGIQLATTEEKENSVIFMDSIKIMIDTGATHTILPEEWAHETILSKPFHMTIFLFDVNENLRTILFSNFVFGESVVFASFSEPILILGISAIQHCYLHTNTREIIII